MKVKQLIKLLEKIDGDAQIILQKDSEGNGYSPLAGAELAIYKPDSTYSGQVYSIDSSADDNELEEKQWSKLLQSKSHKCVVFWPIN